MNEPITWRKSSRCAANGTCVEASAWRTARACAASNGCVEACCTSGGIAFRDNAYPDPDNSPILRFGTAAVAEFFSWIKALP